MSDTEKVLTYEEAKELCREAFDGGVTYGSESMRFGVNARAYDWDHWLKKNEGLFKPKPTVEDVLFEFAQFWSDEELTDIEHLQPHAAQTIAEYAAKLRLADGKE